MNPILLTNASQATTFTEPEPLINTLIQQADLLVADGDMCAFKDKLGEISAELEKEPLDERISRRQEIGRRFQELARRSNWPEIEEMIGPFFAPLLLNNGSGPLLHRTTSTANGALAGIRSLENLQLNFVAAVNKNDGPGVQKALPLLRKMNLWTADLILPTLAGAEKGGKLSAVREIRIFSAVLRHPFKEREKQAELLRREAVAKAMAADANQLAQGTPLSSSSANSSQQLPEEMQDSMDTMSRLADEGKTEELKPLLLALCERKDLPIDKRRAALGRLVTKADNNMHRETSDMIHQVAGSVGISVFGRNKSL